VEKNFEAKTNNFMGENHQPV